MRSKHGVLRDHSLTLLPQKLVVGSIKRRWEARGLDIRGSDHSIVKPRAFNVSFSCISMRKLLNPEDISILNPIRTRNAYKKACLLIVKSLTMLTDLARFPDVDHYGGIGYEWGLVQLAFGLLVPLSP